MRPLAKGLRIAVIVSMLVISAALIYPQLSPGAFRPDVGVFWTAARIAQTDPIRIYDVVAMTEAQRWLTDPARAVTYLAQAADTGDLERRKQHLARCMVSNAMARLRAMARARA